MAEQSQHKTATPYSGTPARIAVLFHRLGPYHHARLRAAARVADITAVEFCEIDRTYAWSKIDEAVSFRHLTLFRHEDIDEQATATVMRHVAAALAGIRPHLVAIPGWSHRAALSALAWCAASGTPAIVMSASTARDEVRVWWREAAKKQLIRGFSAALAGGTAQADYLLQLGMPRKRIFVGYDVVDNDHFASGADGARAAGDGLRQRLGLPERYFLASSRFIPKKNLFNLLQAFAEYRRRVERSAWKLVLLGDGPLKPDLVGFIEANGLSDAVLLPGFKQYDELPLYYGFAQAFVHASTTEQWGLVVNEAMAAALPVIISENCGCVPDLVDEVRNGFRFAPNDVAALADIMQHVASGRCDRSAMGAASRNIIQDWSPATFAEGLRAAADAAIEQRRMRRNIRYPIRSGSSAR